MNNKAAVGVYEQLWKPKAYLQQFYSTPYVSGDEQANFSFLSAGLKQMDRHFRQAIEVGCGPTLHHAMAVAPYVDELHLADYMAVNLDEIRLWLTDDTQQHNWDVYFRGLLAAEGCDDPATLAKRKEDLRQRITALKTADVRRDHPLDDGSTYDLVLSFYCVEAVATSRDEWRLYLSNLCRLVAPSGVLFLSAVRQCHAYHVQNTTFLTACIDEGDFTAVLPELGFLPAKTEIRAVATADWSEQGFDGICCLRCQKNSAAEGT